MLWLESITPWLPAACLLLPGATSHKPFVVMVTRREGFLRLLSVLIANRILIGLEPDGAGQKHGVGCAFGGEGRERERWCLPKTAWPLFNNMLSR